MNRALDFVISAAFWAMSVICLVNLNGFLRMLVGVERGFSDLLLLCCVVALAGLLRVRPFEALGISGVLILATLASYVSIGMAVAIVNGNDFRADAVGYLVRHLSSMLLIPAVAVGGRVVWNRIGGERLMRGVLLVLVAACLLVLASPWLFDIYAEPGLGGGRYSGPFGNPNEAATLACFTVALALALLRLDRLRWVAAAAFALSLGAVILTVSRTAWVTLPVLLAHGLLLCRARERKRLLGGAALACVVLLPPVLGVGANLLSDPNQRNRMLQLLEIVDTGSADGLGSRMMLWRLAAEKAVEAPLVGNGLGEMHHLEKSWFNPEGDLQGAHNQYLVLVGEAGVIALLLFVLFLATLLRRGLGRERDAPLLGAVAGWAVVIGLYGVAHHGLLVQRACCFVIGLGCAVAAAHTRWAAPRRPAASRANRQPMLYAPARRPEPT